MSVCVCTRVQVELTGNNIYEYLHPSDHDQLAALLNQPTACHPHLLHGLTLYYTLPVMTHDYDDDADNEHYD